MTDHEGNRPTSIDADLIGNLDAVGRDLRAIEALAAAALAGEPTDHAAALQLADAPTGLTYDELTSHNRQRRASQGWGEPEIADLLDAAALRELDEWRRAQRIAWTRGDLIAVGIAGLVGALANLYDAYIDATVLKGLAWLKKSDLLRQWEKDRITACIQAVAEHLGMKLRDVMPLMFPAITGQSSSVSVLDAMEILGADLSRFRLRQAVEPEQPGRDQPADDKGGDAGAEVGDEQVARLGTELEGRTAVRRVVRAIERGEVTWDDARRSATRVVATLLRFDDVLSRAVADRGVLGSEAHRSLAREVAARSVVVLRNEAIDGVPLLPVAPGSRVFVVGELASQVNLGDRGSSDVWDLDARPVIEGLAEVFEIVDDAADADLAVVVVGTTFADEGEFIGSTDPSLMQLFPGADDPELAARYGAQIAAIPDTERPARLGDGSDAFGQGGDRTSLRLRDDEIALIRSVVEANPRTVVVVQSGSAVLCSEWVGAVPGLVMGWYGGCRAGSGLADVLSGAVNPSARLPFTVPVDEADLPFFDRDATAIRYDEWHGWWHAERLGRAPLFPFGYGLSYTTFATVAATASVEASAVVVRGVVRNTGAVAGADVMQVYVNREVDGRVPVLGGFARVEVGAGAETEFTVRVPLDRLAVRDADAHAWRSPSGSYRLTVGRHAGDPDGVELVVDL